MSETIANQSAQHPETHHLPCHVCGRENNHLVSLRDVQEDLRAIIRANTRPAVQFAEVCPKCLDLFNRAKAHSDTHAAIFEQTSFVLPTPLRMGAV